MTDRITVSFACNDDHGRFTGHCKSIEFDTDDGGHVSLFTTDLDKGFALEFLDSVDVVKVAGSPFSIVNYSHRSHEGNLIWDSVKTDIGESRRLLKHLMRNCDCQLDEWDDSELGRLADSLFKADADAEGIVRRT